MSVNSLSSNDSVPHLNLSSTDGNRSLETDCFHTRQNLLIYTSFIFTSILLLLPLCIFILHHSLQQWRKKRSTSSASTMSHSDCFTYHLVVMELVGVIGQILCCCGVYRHDFEILRVGGLLLYFMWFGEMFFHLLTCGERYLAVVHPITYLSLRRERGVRLRNISVVCVWLLCFVGTGLVIKNAITVMNFCLSILSLTIISFCSLSVLCVLIGPGPGEQGGGWERVDQSKKRAFYNIAAILGVLVLRFTYDLVWSVLNASKANVHCVMVTYEIWFNLPSSLVLPLLFIQRQFGKFMCCKKNNQ